MAHQFADALDGHVAVGQGGAEGVAQQVGMERAEAGPLGIAAQRAPDGAPRELRPAVQLAEDVRTVLGPALFQPGAQGILGLEIERHHPLPPPLAGEAQPGGFGGPVHVLQGQVAGLRDPQAAAGHHLDQGLVAPVLGHRPQPLQLVGAEGLGQAPGRRAEAHRSPPVQRERCGAGARKTMHTFPPDQAQPNKMAIMFGPLKRRKGKQNGENANKTADLIRPPAGG